MTATADRPICVALLGLGEAGAAFAADLIGLGVTTAGRDLVPSLTSGASALAAAAAVVPALSPQTLFVDPNTTGIAVKRGVATAVRAAGASFADVALLAPVLDHGIRTPALASGDGAAQYAEIMSSLGVPVEVVGPGPGDIAATLGDADESLVDRLVVGSEHHAVRRIAELEAAAELLRELGVEPHAAEAAADVLRRVRDS